MAYSEWDESSYYEEKNCYQYDKQRKPNLVRTITPAIIRVGIVIDEKEESVWNDKNINLYQ
jgi:hypothetical protein